MGILRIWSCIALLFHLQGSLAAVGGHCPPLGPVLPAPTAPSDNQNVTRAVSTIKSLLNILASNFNNSGIAIGVKSIHEDDLLLEYAYTPPNFDQRGVEKIDSDTVFRLASLSKVFPVLAILKLHGVRLYDPITDYLPELRDLNKQAREQNAIWTIEWDEITLGSLASHLAGIPSDLIADLQAYADWTQFGFPPLDESRNLNCSGEFGLPPCEQSVFDELFGQRPPVSAPFSPSPVYSNIGWVLLGQVITRVTTLSPEEFIREHIWKPSGMNRTFAEEPDAELGFIPTDDTWWNSTLGFEAPAGAYYSTINDLHAFGDAVLRHKLLSPAKTRKWFKPVSGTSSPGILIGQPWEIYRSQKWTKDRRLIEIYTKAGDLMSYHSLMAFVPDYDLVITLLCAGPETGGVLHFILSELLTRLLPAVENAGKQDAKKTYGGTYEDSATNSSITLALDDGPGFSIANWTIRGVDVIETLLSINVPPIVPAPEGQVRFRLYPTTLNTGNQSSWRALPTIGTEEENKELEDLFAWPEGTCNSWAGLDRTTYQLLSQDHFVFTEEEGDDGKVATHLEAVAYGVTLERQT